MKSMDVLKGLTLVYNEEEAAEINKIISFINKYSFLFVEFNKQDNKIQLEIDDENSIGTSFLLQIIIDNEIVAEKEIEILESLSGD